LYLAQGLVGRRFFGSLILMVDKRLQERLLPVERVAMIIKAAHEEALAKYYGTGSPLVLTSVV
jgi:hypothetical protein